LPNRALRCRTILTFVPIDFETTSLRQALGATRFAFDVSTFCS
jgi:hypothetical protein